jgi:hypothetical protein
VVTIINEDNPSSYQRFVLGKNAENFFDHEMFRTKKSPPPPSFVAAEFDGKTFEQTFYTVGQVATLPNSCVSSLTAVDIKAVFALRRKSL